MIWWWWWVFGDASGGLEWTGFCGGVVLDYGCVAEEDGMVGVGTGEVEVFLLFQLERLLQPLIRSRRSRPLKIR